MNNLWKCSVCKKVTPEKDMLVDDSVFNSPTVQYGCPKCRNMNCMERVDDQPDE